MKRLTGSFVVVLLVLMPMIAGCEKGENSGNGASSFYSYQEELITELPGSTVSLEERRAEVAGYIEEGLLQTPDRFLSEHSATAEEFFYPYWLFLNESEQKLVYQNASEESRAVIDEVREWFDDAVWAQE